MTVKRKRDEATRANEAMNRTFTGDGVQSRRGDPRQQSDATTEPDDRQKIEGEAAQKANESARVRRPYP